MNLFIYLLKMNSKAKKTIHTLPILNQPNKLPSLTPQYLNGNKIKKDIVNKCASLFHGKKLKKHNKNRKNNSLDMIAKKFIQCVIDERKNKINLKSIIEKIKVKKRRIYDVTNVLEGIGLIKKCTKNEIQLNQDFYDLYTNNFDNIIELNEEKNNQKAYNNNNNGKNNILRLNKIHNEINMIDILIKKTNDRLINLQNSHKENKNNNNNFNLFLINKDIYPLINDKNKNLGLIGVKSKHGINNESIIIKEPINIIEQKKLDNDMGNLHYNDEFLNSSSFSNRLYIVSRNDEPINLFNIELKIKKEIDKEKEKEIENDNYIDLFNNNIYINNNDINFGISKNNNNTQNAEMKDSKESNYSLIENMNNFNTLKNYLNNTDI